MLVTVEVAEGDVTAVVNHATHIGFARKPGRSGDWTFEDRAEAVRWLLSRTITKALEPQQQ